MHFLRRFDYFTKTKEEFDSSTSIGGFFSLVALAIGIIFFILELRSFMKYDIVKEMGVDNDILTREETVNFEFLFYQIPCQLISVYRFELEGASQAEVTPKMERYIPETDALIPYTRDRHLEHLPAFFEEIVQAVEKNEGCKLTGSVGVMEVPGSFEFSVKEKGHYYRMLRPELQEKISVSFILNHLSFGNRSLHNTIYNAFKLSKIFSPFDGDDHSDIKHNEKLSYFVKIVPNQYHGKKLGKMRAYQYSLNHNVKTMDFNEFPTFTLTYEFSPIIVNYKMNRNSYARFIVDTLAIIGGVFAVIGMINSFVLSRSQYLRRH